MKKRKGFTLIELLAVIVILAIIAVIATPIIVGIIEDSRKAAFERSVEGIIHATDIDFGTQETLANNTYTITDGQVDKILKTPIKNIEGFSGTIKYNENGKSSYAINNGKWCITKGYNDEKGTLSENIDDCILTTDESCFTYEGGVEDNEYTIINKEACKTFMINEFGATEEQAISACNNELMSEFGGLTLTEALKNNPDMAMGFLSENIVELNPKYTYEIIDKEACKKFFINEANATEEEAISGCNNEPISDFGNLTLTEQLSLFTEEIDGYEDMVLPLIDNNIVRQNINGGIKITDYDIACGTNVTIPNMIDNKHVKTIGTSAFENKGITSVKLGEGLQTIEKYAFFNNPITSINIPDTLTEIEDDAFYDLSITNTSEEYQKIMAINSNAITTPTDEDCFTYQDVEGGIEITNYSTSCPREVVIPSKIDEKKVVSIGEYAFESNLSESEISYNKLNKGIEFMSNDVELAEALMGNIEKVIIPDTVTYIEGWAFASNQISSVKFGNNVEYIGQDAFSGNLLTEISLPVSIIAIDNDAFRYNRLSGELDLSNLINLNYIGGYAFSDNLLSGAIVPDNVVSFCDSFRWNNDDFVGIYKGETFTLGGGACAE